MLIMSDSIQCKICGAVYRSNYGLNRHCIATHDLLYRSSGQYIQIPAADIKMYHDRVRQGQSHRIRDNLRVRNSTTGRILETIDDVEKFISEHRKLDHRGDDISNDDDDQETPTSRGRLGCEHRCNSNDSDYDDEQETVYSRTPTNRGPLKLQQHKKIKWSRY